MMLQEIAPHVYDRSYDTRPATAEDRVLCCIPGKVLLHRIDQQTWELPRLRDLQGEGYPEVLVGSYLFRIDGENCYLGRLRLDETVPADGILESGVLPEDMIWYTGQQARDVRPLAVSFAAVTGQQLSRWYKNRTFCGRCGGRMEPSQVERAMVCPHCGLTEYPRICPGVIVAVTDGDRILLTRSKQIVTRNYALISGYVEIGESLEQTIAREVMEEVGLKVKNLRYYKSQPWGFSDTMMVGYWCEVDGPTQIRRDDGELSEAFWATREEMPSRAGDVSLTAEMMELFRNRQI